ncbi:hypothetical protein Bca52824_095451 [Brassica carinata]|uniref:Uncharacterized protein n=1 Tax=Brassica carinata TaxID=52824 RepID=A0A8X7P2I4_BRACI|nr:hypothetical protein Bca52824_095451 [Brassica carinata]
MEGIKKSGSSSSSPSLTCQLFGSRDNPPSSSSSSSSGIFGSIFAPPSKVMGQETVTGGWNDKSSKAGNLLTKAFFINRNNKRVQPCHLSSSIYYGGPDVYFQPQSQNSSANSAAQKKKEGGEDDSGSASRGNWWQEPVKRKNSSSLYVARRLGESRDPVAKRSISEMVRRLKLFHLDSIDRFGFESNRMVDKVGGVVGPSLGI